MTTIPVPLASISPDLDNPRKSAPPGDIARLAESIRARGLLLPLRVRPADAAGRHAIVSGHRRHAALLALGAEMAPCVVADGPPDECAVLAEQLAENLLREELGPLDEAGAYRRYLDLRGVTAAQAAGELHVPPARVSRALALLTLPEPVRAAVRAGRIPADTAYHLSRLPEGAERDRLVAGALAGALTRDAAARAAKVGPRAPAESAAKRVTCRLPGARSVTLVGPAVRLDGLIDALEEALKEARKARQQGLDVTTLAKVLRDRAANGGAA